MKFKILLTLFSFLVLSASANARGWEKIGERTVNFLTEKDVIHCSHKGTFKKLRFRVEKNGVEFEQINIIFASGANQKINIRQKIHAGGESRVIDLRGNKRIIKRIELVYRTDNDRGNRNRKAEVTVYGQK